MRKSIAGAFLLAANIVAASAQNYPDRSIKVVVPYPAGGPTDTIARAVTQSVGAALGQSMIIENQSGAGGRIAMKQVANATPDGYTLLLGGTNNNGITPAVYKDLDFDAVKDFAPVASIAIDLLGVVVHPSVPVKTLAELAAYAKANPGKLTSATQGNGTTSHLTSEMFQMLAGVKVQHVPYRGSAPALNDLIAGNVPLMMDSMITGLPHVRAGTLKGLAVSTAKRSALAPDIPTVAESGIPGFEAFLWYGIVAPAYTPPDVVQTLGREIAAVMKLPEIRERLIALGSEPAESGPESFAAFIKAEAEKWGPIVVSSGAKAE